MTRMARPMLACLALVWSGCSKESKPEPEPAKTEKTAEAPEPAEPGQETLERAQALFNPLPEEMKADGLEITDAKVDLGRVLYHDTRLSKNQDLSCASCHALDHFGIEARADSRDKGTSAGHKGAFGERNSPTVYNAALHIAQFWDGRAATVEEQAKGPILNPVEMAMKDEKAVVAVLESIPGYEAMFVKAFGEQDPITYDHMAEAIGAFERRLVTPAPFDDYLKGDLSAISEEAQEGLELFMSKGCTPCHIGAGVGGTMYQKLGLIKPYETEDTGRYQATGNEADKYFFKVPSLRNVAETAPYFHDGSIKTLPEAVQIMAEHQTPSGKLTDAEVASIVEFLKTLTGKPPAELIAAPELPESGPKTPKPDPS